MQMLREERSVVMRPYGSWGLLLACIPKGWKRRWSSVYCCWLLSFWYWSDWTNQSPFTLTSPVYTLTMCSLFLHLKYHLNTRQILFTNVCLGQLPSQQQPHKYIHVWCCRTVLEHTNQYRVQSERVNHLMHQKWNKAIIICLNNVFFLAIK